MRLAALLFETLTGRVYYQQRPGARARLLRSDVPVWLDDLIAKMLAHAPENRPGMALLSQNNWNRDCGSTERG